MHDTGPGAPGVLEALGGFTISASAFGLTFALILLQNHNRIPDAVAMGLLVANAVWLAAGLGWLAWRSRALLAWGFPFWLLGAYLIDQNTPTWVPTGCFLAICWVFLWRLRSRPAGVPAALAAALGVGFTVHPPLLTKNPVRYLEYWDSAFHLLLPQDWASWVSAGFETATPALWMLGALASFVLLFTLHLQHLLWATRTRREQRLPEC